MTDERKAEIEEEILRFNQKAAMLGLAQVSCDIWEDEVELTQFGTPADSVVECVGRLLWPKCITEIGVRAIWRKYIEYDEGRLIIPRQIKKIGTEALSGNGLHDQRSAELVLPETLERIGAAAFADRHLTGRLVLDPLPSANLMVGNEAFRGCMFSEAFIGEHVRYTAPQIFGLTNHSLRKLTVRSKDITLNLSVLKGLRELDCTLEFLINSCRDYEEKEMRRFFRMYEKTTGQKVDQRNPTYLEWIVEKSEFGDYWYQFDPAVGFCGNLEAMERYYEVHCKDLARLWKLPLRNFEEIECILLPALVQKRRYKLRDEEFLQAAESDEQQTELAQIWAQALRTEEEICVTVDIECKERYLGVHEKLLDILHSAGAEVFAEIEDVKTLYPRDKWKDIYSPRGRYVKQLKLSLSRDLHSQKSASIESVEENFAHGFEEAEFYLQDVFPDVYRD